MPMSGLSKGVRLPSHNCRKHAASIRILLRTRHGSGVYHRADDPECRHVPRGHFFLHAVPRDPEHHERNELVRLRVLLFCLSRVGRPVVPADHLLRHPAGSEAPAARKSARLKHNCNRRESQAWKACMLHYGCWHVSLSKIKCLRRNKQSNVARGPHAVRT